MSIRFALLMVIIVNFSRGNLGAGIQGPALIAEGDLLPNEQMVGARMIWSDTDSICVAFRERNEVKCFERTGTLKQTLTWDVPQGKNSEFSRGTQVEVVGDAIYAAYDYAGTDKLRQTRLFRFNRRTGDKKEISIRKELIADDLRFEEHRVYLKDRAFVWSKSENGKKRKKIFTSKRELLWTGSLGAGNPGNTPFYLTSSGDGKDIVLVNKEQLLEKKPGNIWSMTDPKNVFDRGRIGLVAIDNQENIIFHYGKCPKIDETCKDIFEYEWSWGVIGKKAKQILALCPQVSPIYGGLSVPFDHQVDQVVFADGKWKLMGWSY